MPTDVVMPQMGESIAEGTIVRWIKKLGDQVARDEPLFEISTDKVDAEIPSPAAGVLSEIRVKEGETVAVNSVVAVIGQSAESGAGPARAPSPAAAAAVPPPGATPPSVAAPPPSAAPSPAVSPPPPAAPSSAATQSPTPAPPRSDEMPRATAPQPPNASPSAQEDGGLEGRIHQRSSPLVRKIAKDNNVDISQIKGTGISGRVTKDDILDFIAHSGAGRLRFHRRGGADARAADRDTPGA